MLDSHAAQLSKALCETGLGDKRAFAVVYHMSVQKLYGICFRICRERTAAEDVLQDAYIAIWSRAHCYDPGKGSALSWLSVVARNRALDWYRVQRATMVLPETVFLIEDPAPSAPETLISRQREQMAIAALNGLEQHQAVAIREAFFNDATYAELANRAGVPLGTMKSWIRRGLLQMRSNMRE